MPYDDPAPEPTLVAPDLAFEITETWLGLDPTTWFDPATFDPTTWFPGREPPAIEEFQPLDTWEEIPRDVGGCVCPPAGGEEFGSEFDDYEEPDFESLDLDEGLGFVPFEEPFVEEPLVDQDDFGGDFRTPILHTPSGAFEVPGQVPASLESRYRPSVAGRIGHGQGDVPRGPTRAEREAWEAEWLAAQRARWDIPPSQTHSIKGD